MCPVPSYSGAGSPLKKRLRVSKWIPNNDSSFNLDSQYTYNNEGKMTAVQYPSSWNGSSWVAGPNLGNTFDSMGRLQKLTDLAASSDIISNTSYGVAGQLLSMTGANGAPSETRTYNSIGQMTRLQSGSLDIQYAFSATQNNGKIASETDSVSGEQVVYTYDSLNRLASATSSVNPGWGQSYTYDGFGNLTTQTVTKGSAPSLSTTYDPATNRQTGECADANGNLNSASVCYSGSAAYYDVENRLVHNAGSLAWAYSYAPGNKRVWRGQWTVDANNNYTQTTDEVTYWSVSGQKLATYQLSAYGIQLVATATGTNYYFGGKLIKNAGGYVTPDRLGSIGKYFPYGQERPSATTDGKEKFATYFRDSETGLDYADQRYHQPGMGRFMTADPYKASAGPGDPGSWNRYAYTRGDPVNRGDPSGLLDCDPLTCITVSANVDPVEYITISLTQTVGSWWANQAAAAIAAAQGLINTQAQQGPLQSVRILPGTFHDDGANQDKISDVLKKIQTALSSDTTGCANWLTGGADWIGTLLDGNLFGHGQFNQSSVRAISGDKNPDGSSAGLPVGKIFAVNDNSAFFQGFINGAQTTVGPANYNGGTLAAQALILIHELAHQLNISGFPDDFGNSAANDQTVDKNCGKLIGGLR